MAPMGPTTRAWTSGIDAPDWGEDRDGVAPLARLSRRWWVKEDFHIVGEQRHMPTASQIAPPEDLHDAIGAQHLPAGAAIWLIGYFSISSAGTGCSSGLLEA